MHGYQLMQAIADRTGGRWTPSPGTIYPTISQLADEGLVVVTTESGRKLATLTEEGRASLERDRDTRPDPFAAFDGEGPDIDLRALLAELHGAVRQVGRSGDLGQRTAAAKVLADARRSIYLLLADGPTGQPEEE